MEGSIGKFETKYPNEMLSNELQGQNLETSQLPFKVNYQKLGSIILSILSKVFSKV